MRLVYLPSVNQMQIPTTIKIGTTWSGQIPQRVHEKLNIKEGDILIVEIREVLKGTTSTENGYMESFPSLL